VTDDGTTEVTSCGSRCPSEHSGGQRQQKQVSDALMAGEMSQHERASSWIDNLPMESSASAPAAGAAARDDSRCAGAETRSVSAQDQSSISRSVFYEDKYVYDFVFRCYSRSGLVVTCLTAV